VNRAHTYRGIERLGKRAHTAVVCIYLHVTCNRNRNRNRSALQTHERRHQSKVYGKCFSGVQLVDWLVETMDQDKLAYVTKVWNCTVSHLASGGQVREKSPACLRKEPCMPAKRALYACEKSPACLRKEPCMPEIRAPHARKGAPDA